MPKVIHCFTIFSEKKIINTMDKLCSFLCLLLNNLVVLTLRSLIENIQNHCICLLYLYNHFMMILYRDLKRYFLFKQDLDRSTTNLKFDPHWVQTHDLQIMTVSRH